MKIAAIICNVFIFAFTCLVLATDGTPKEAVYIVFTLWSLLTPLLSAAVISQMKKGDGRLDLLLKRKTGEGPNQPDHAFPMRTKMRITAMTFNIIHIGFICWALVDQYPHPEEDGFIEYVVLMVLTPILSLATLFRGGEKNVVKA
jgi:hypothetical protein